MKWHRTFQVPHQTLIRIKARGLLFSPWPLPVSDGPRKPSVDRVRVQLCELEEFLQTCGLSFYTAHPLSGSRLGRISRGESGIVSHPGWQSLRSIPFSGLAIPSPSSAKQTGRGILDLIAQHEVAGSTQLMSQDLVGYPGPLLGPPTLIETASFRLPANGTGSGFLPRPG